MKIVKTSPFAVLYKFRLGLSTSGRTLNRKKSGMILESLLPKCIACVCVCVLRCTFIERLILLLILLLLFSILPCLAPPWRCHCEAGCHGDAELWRQNTLQCQTIHERAKKRGNKKKEEGANEKNPKSLFYAQTIPLLRHYNTTYAQSWRGGGGAARLSRPGRPVNSAVQFSPLLFSVFFFFFFKQFRKKNIKQNLFGPTIDSHFLLK